MKKLWCCVSVVVLFAAGNAHAMPQSHKHKPDFTLTISINPEPLAPHSDGRKAVSVLVVEKNISKHRINVGRLRGPDDWYTMTVLRNGNPSPFTEEYKRAHQFDPNASVEVSPYTGMLKPGQTQTFEVILSEVYNLSATGQYTIAFSRGTDPGRPDNVEVKSNTLKIAVLPAENPTSK